MNSLTTLSSGERSHHARIRSNCDSLWRDRTKPFRLVRSRSWTGYGRGIGYLWMLKWGDTYVIGPRNEWMQAGEYPQYAKLGMSHETRFQAFVDIHTDIPPTGWFWSKRPWFIVKPDCMYSPAIMDITRNNMAEGMGLWHWRMYNDTNFLSARSLAALTGVFCGGRLITGGLKFDDEGVHTYGYAVDDPVLQIYDKGIYNRGRKALSAVDKLLAVYMDRHKILNPGWAHEGWHPDFMWDIYHRHEKQGVEGFSPHWLIEAYRRAVAERAGRQPPWFRTRMQNIPRVASRQLTKYWKEEGVRAGFVRIAERGTPLYNEVSPVEPDTTDYDRLILED